MGINVRFNPFDLIIEITKELWPDLDCDIYFADVGEFDGDKAYGVTCFNDSGTAEIAINPRTPIEGAVEILAHELAHVVAGEAVEAHGEEWQSAFELINEKYNCVVEELIGRRGQ